MNPSLNACKAKILELFPTKQNEGTICKKWTRPELQITFRVVRLSGMKSDLYLLTVFANSCWIHNKCFSRI